MDLNYFASIANAIEQFQSKKHLQGFASLAEALPVIDRLSKVFSVSEQLIRRVSQSEK
ncbi:MAG: hypothetical protein U0401_08350 [Anaerolineae bacterium]